MARDGSQMSTVTNCFELFRNRYGFPRPVRGSPTGATSATHHLSQPNASISSRQRSPPLLAGCLEDHIINVQKLVRMCHDRIAAHDGIRHGRPSELMHAVNPHAFDQADNSVDDRDRENGAGRRQGALAGRFRSCSRTTSTRGFHADDCRIAGLRGVRFRAPTRSHHAETHPRSESRERMTTDSTASRRCRSPTAACSTVARDSASPARRHTRARSTVAQKTPGPRT